MAVTGALLPLEGCTTIFFQLMKESIACRIILPGFWRIGVRWSWTLYAPPFFLFCCLFLSATCVCNRRTFANSFFHLLLSCFYLEPQYLTAFATPCLLTVCHPRRPQAGSSTVHCNPVMKEGLIKKSVIGKNSNAQGIIAEAIK